MQFALLLDENVEVDLARKLERDGHDVERVVDIESLGPGTPDSAVRQYARETDRLIVTYDDHFTDPDDDLPGVFFCPNPRLSTFDVFRIISAVGTHVEDREDLPPVVFLSEDWL